MNYYSKIADGYNELHSEEQVKKVKRIIKELNIGRESVLDVGCGTAFYSNLFYNYTGLDSSKGMLRKSKGKIFFGTAEKLPFADNSFDVVICVTAIHNFNDPKKAIEEMKRVGRNKFAISVLRKSIKFQSIRNLIHENLSVREVEEDKDIIFIQTGKT